MVLLMSLRGKVNIGFSHMYFAQSLWRLLALSLPIRVQGPQYNDTLIRGGDEGTLRSGCGVRSGCAGVPYVEARYEHPITIE